MSQTEPRRSWRRCVAVSNICKIRRRGILFGPGWKDVDVSLKKGFALPIPDRTTVLQIRGDAFDSLNALNFGIPNVNIGTSQVGTITTRIRAATSSSELTSDGVVGVSRITDHVPKRQEHCVVPHYRRRRGASVRAGRYDLFSTSRVHGCSPGGNSMGPPQGLWKAHGIVCCGELWRRWTKPFQGQPMLK